MADKRGKSRGRVVKKKSVKRYIATYAIQWGPSFTLDEGQEFTEADLLPGMKAALRKWLRVGAAVEIVEDESKPAERSEKDPDISKS